MPVNTSFSSVNEQLDFQNNAPITIDDTLVRALTGVATDIPPKSPISFSDLSGKLGVGPLIGPSSNSQAGYFPTNSSIDIQFLTDIYQANVVWTCNLISGSAVTFTPSGSNSTVLLQRNTVGNSASNASVTAAVYYGNTLIGSNTVYLSLQSDVYDSNLTFSSTPAGFAASSKGYAAQTATLSITAQANVPNGIISWTVTPNNAGAVSISGNTITLISTSTSMGVVNSTSYQVSARVFLDGKPVVGAGGGVTANVYAFMYSNDFIFTTPANTAASANSGPLTVSVPFSVSGNAPGTVITWGSTPISGSAATLTVASGNLSANLSLLIAPDSLTYAAANSVTTVTANMYSDSSKTTLIATHSANVSLEGLVYGLDYTPPVSNTRTGYTAQTVSSTASATYKAGTFNWIYSAISGVASITQTTGVAGGAAATLSISDALSGKTGSNSSSWSVTPRISYGSISVTRPSTNVNLNATVQPFNLVITGSTSNAQYANSGPVSSSVSLSVSGSTPPGTNVIWTATKVSGPNSTFAISSNNQNSTLTYSVDANTFAFNTAIYNITANCYDTSSNWSLNSNTIQVSLIIGTFGLNISALPASNTQSGYNAQTASTTASATVQAGQFAWWHANTAGIAPSFSSTGVIGSAAGYYKSGSATWSQTTSSPATNTATEQWQIAVFAPGNTTSALYISGTQTFSLTAQQNAYSFSVPVATTNTQLLGSTSSALTIATTPVCNIAGYSLSGWSTSNTTPGYSLSTNTTAAVVGFSTTLSSAAPVAYYTTTISGNLLDSSSRLVQSFSYPVVLRSYFPNPVISFSNSAVYGYIAQTASGSYTLNLWNGATALSVGTSITGNAPTLTNGVQNTSYWNMGYSLATGGTYQDLSDTIVFQPTISFYDQVSSYAGWAVTAALSANNYNPGASLSIANDSAAGWTGTLTAYGVITGSANASIPNPSWRWGAFTTTSGSFTSSYLQGTGNNQFVAYSQASSIGTVSGVGYMPDAVIMSNGVDLAHTGASASVSASATKYNPALVISGPTSNTTSAQFTSTASIVLTASANASIPGVSYQCTATAVSGSASVSIPAGNTSCTLSVTGLHTTAAATYNVTFSVLSSGTVLQSVTKQVSLSATGTVPNYTLTTPANVSAAGFNFAQTCSSTCYLNGLTASGDYATWNMYNVSGTTPAWATPGGSNGHITTTQSRGSVGSTSGTIYQRCNVYDPSGNFIKTLQSGNYALTSTVYNPALTVSVANAAVSGAGSLTAESTVTLGSNGGIGDYQLSIVKSSGATGTVSINAANTGGSLSLTSSSTANAVYSYNASILLNGQTIAGPITGTMYSAVTITYTPVSATLSSNSASGAASGMTITGTVQTNWVTAIGHGGSGPYTYNWIITSQTSDGGAVTTVYPTQANTYWYAQNIHTSATATAVCTVSDGTSSANTPVVGINLSWTSNK